MKVARILIPATIPNSFRSLMSVVSSTKNPMAVVKLVMKVTIPIFLTIRLKALILLPCFTNSW